MVHFDHAQYDDQKAVEHVDYDKKDQDEARSEHLVWGLKESHEDPLANTLGLVTLVIFEHELTDEQEHGHEWEHDNVLYEKSQFFLTGFHIVNAFHAEHNHAVSKCCKRNQNDLNGLIVCNELNREHNERFVNHLNWYQVLVPVWFVLQVDLGIKSAKFLYCLW